MKTYWLPLVSAALLPISVSCGPPVDDPGTPPLFNAVDPSVQCEAGHVGWDFSTGGNTGGIRRNAVGGTIAITQATFGGACEAGLAEAFQSACDGYGTCTLPVPGCTNADVTLTYQCGTESPTYRAQIEAGADGDQITVVCGSRITIVNAVYAPNAEAPADITNELARICTGKRRCANGQSGFQLNSYQDPLPNVAKKVQVTYVCDAEALERQALVDDFTLDFYCQDPAKPPPQPIEFISIQSVVPRSLQRERLVITSSTPPQVVANEQSIYDSQRERYEEYAAGVFDRISASCDLERECQLEFPPMSDNDERTYYQKIEPEEGTVDVLGAELNPAALRGNYQAYFVGYTCGADPGLNWKLVPFVRFNQPAQKLRLQCGERLEVTDVYVGQEAYTADDKSFLLDLLQSNCDGKRVCYAPTPQGRSYDWYYDENDAPRFRNFEHRSESVKVEYTCGDIDFARRYVADIDYSELGAKHFECEPQSADLFARGIRIASVSPASLTQEVTALCFGRDRCALPRVNMDVTYRCGEGTELLSQSSSGVGNSGGIIECRPAANFKQRYVIDAEGRRVDVVGNRCEYWVYADKWTPPGGTFFPDSAGGVCSQPYYRPNCPFNIPYDTDGDGTNDATIDICAQDEVYWDFQCGADPSDIQTFASVRGENWDDDAFPVYPRYIEDIGCTPPLTPFVKKTCVPEQCLGKSRRNEELECEPDASLIPTFYRTTPIVKTYAVNDDGTPARWGGVEVGTNVSGELELKSGFPYQIFPLVSYQTEGGSSQPLPDDTLVTTWAYDVFELTDSSATDANGAPLAGEVFGFRCLLNSTSIEDAYRAYPGYWRMYAGGTPATVIDACYGHDKAKSNDPSTSWYDAAKRAKLPESTFKSLYQRRETKMLTSVDADGQNTVRWFGAATYIPVNPVGFYYDPARDWIDMLGYYAQSADVGLQKTVRFVDSTDIEIGAVLQSVSADFTQVDVNDPTIKPQIAVDFSWYLRGNSVKNPFSPDTQDVNGPDYSLRHDNLRAVVEIAAVQDGAASNWAVVDAARFVDSPELTSHNPFFATQRIQVQVSDVMRRRILAVRGDNTVVGETLDGWMKTFKDEDTAFDVRTCLVSDTFPFLLGDSDAPPPSETVGDYELGMAQRCSKPSRIMLYRELYETPEPIALGGAAESEGASMGGSGDSDVKEDRDTGSQSSCVTLCMIDGDCNGGTCGDDGRCVQTIDQQRCNTENRSSSGSGVGSEGLSLYANRTDNQVGASNGAKTTTTTNQTELLGFQVMDIEQPRSVQVNDASPTYDITIDTGFDIGAIIDAARGIQQGASQAPFGVAFNGKETRIRGQKRFGIEFLLFVRGRFAVGPFPMSLRFEWATQLTPALTLRFAGGRFTEASDNLANSYPCFVDDNGNGNKCYSAETEAKSLSDARASCREKGGRLATAVTSAEASALSAAVSNGQQPHWIGAVSRYLYQYKPCGDVGTPQATAIPPSIDCAARSETSYTWMTSTGDEAGSNFARQAGRSTAITHNKLPAPLSMKAVASYVTSGDAGVYYQKTASAGGTNEQLSHKPVGEALPYVCEYDPAAVVGSSAQDISIAIEVMSALRLELCTPSEDIGICLEGRMKFFTAELRFGLNLRQTDIYTPDPIVAGVGVPYSTLNGTELYGIASISFLVADINVILRFIFWDTSILIKRFDPVASWTKTLFSVPNNSYQLHVETP